MFAPYVAQHGIPVAEFNLETTPATSYFEWVEIKNIESILYNSYKIVIKNFILKKIIIY